MNHTINTALPKLSAAERERVFLATLSQVSPAEREQVLRALRSIAAQGKAHP